MTPTRASWIGMRILQRERGAFDKSPISYKCANNDIVSAGVGH